MVHVIFVSEITFHNQPCVPFTTMHCVPADTRPHGGGIDRKRRHSGSETMSISSDSSFDDSSTSTGHFASSKRLALHTPSPAAYGAIDDNRHPRGIVPCRAFGNRKCVSPPRAPCASPVLSPTHHGSAEDDTVLSESFAHAAARVLAQHQPSTSSPLAQSCDDDTVSYTHLTLPTNRKV